MVIQEICRIQVRSLAAPLKESFMANILCPNCGQETGAAYVYYPEYGCSWPHGSGVVFCKHPAEHEGDRHLVCAGCGLVADREGVVAPNGGVILYQHSTAAQIIKRNC